MRNEKSSVIILGAGLGGLTAALSLLQQGFDVQVFEQAKELKEVGAGLQLSANANRVLHNLGLAKQLQAIASEPAGKEIRLWNSGQSWKLFDLGTESVSRYGYPYYTVYRADLHKLLVEAVLALKPDAIQLDSRCVDVEQGGSMSVVRLENGATHTADVVVAADGVHSVIRSKLIAPDTPEFSGCMAWRGVIASDRLPDHLRSAIGVNWVGPGAHVIHYPMRQDRLINFVGIVEKSQWQVESWTERGTIEECAQDFAGWHPDVHTLIQALETPFKWALMVRKPLEHWTSGNVTLLGDAAHPTLPFLAQGAAMAIEDGFVLGRCLAKYADPVSALRAFEAARISRTSKIVQGSADNAKRFHNPALASAEGAADYVSQEWNSEKVQERYDWLFSYNVNEVAI